MKTTLLAASLLLFTSFFAFAQTANPTSQTVLPAIDRQTLLQELIGNWEIDLRPTPTDSPYIVKFTITKLDGEGVLQGTFYDTPFTNGRINTEWGKLHFAFTTSDGSNTYFTSGYLSNGKLSGATFTEGRGFVMPWFSIGKK